MENISKLLKECEYLNDENSILEATNFIQKKLNKEETSHNINIAIYLAKSKLSKETIIAGILYKTENYKTEIKNIFGEEISEIINGQQQLKEIKDKSKFKKTNPIRQIILTTIKDPRIIFIKLAAKLSNLNRLQHLNTNEKKSIANEAIEIYAPIASRLGLELIRKNILDSAFKIINEKKYLEIQNFLKESQEEREKYIKKIISDFENLLENENVKIKGREKQLYSIYEKTTKRGIPLTKQRDHFAIRIITKNIEKCYDCFGKICEKYSLMPNTLKDYIKNPKENGYQSLHITLLLENKKMLEVQIRTEEMDNFAEEGLAAHYLYKGIKSNQKFEKKTAWLKEILNLENTQSINKLKLNLFEDKIYCYTPKGDAYHLPKESTVLDFAYQIHAEVGSKAVAGLINKKFTSLKTKIKNGDIIEIITNKFQRPRRSWMKFVVTPKAKKLISRDVKKFENIPVAKTYLREDTEKNKIETPVEMLEFPNHIINFAQCCKAIPPHEIVGIIKSHKRILIHKKDCDRIKEAKKSQFPAEWKESFEKPVKITTIAIDRSGILADLLNTIIRQGIKAVETNAKLIENNCAECSFAISIQSIEELEEIIERLNKIKGVKKIYFE